MRGVLVLVPSWVDKKTWFSNLPSKYAKRWIDGTETLEKIGILTNEDIWYDYTKQEEMILISNQLRSWLEEGYNIVYTANPHLIKADILIIPPIHKDSNVETLQLNRERLAFNTASSTIVLTSEFPEVKVLHKMSKYCIHDL